MLDSDKPIPADAADLIARVGGRPLSYEEMLTMLNTGCSYEEAKARSEETARINDLADRVRGLPISEWPAFDVLWDCDPDHFYFVFDGAEPKSIAPGEIEVVQNVSIQAIDAALTPHWHRRADEVWSVGDPRKAARVIVRWVEGLAMTPPLLMPTMDLSGLVISGGNHRLAVARAKGVEAVPILIKAEHKTTVLHLLKIQT